VYQVDWYHLWYYYRGTSFHWE